MIWKYRFDDVIKGTGSLFHDRNAMSPENSLIIIQGARMGLDAAFDQQIVPSLRGISYFTGEELWRMNCRRTETYSRDVDGSAV